MENVTIGKDAFFARRILPGRVNQVEHVVAILKVHGQAFETIRDFARDRLAFQATNLLEVGELRHFHAVHPDFPTKTPSAKRRVFPVIFHETDIVHFSIDTQSTQAT